MSPSVQRAQRRFARAIWLAASILILLGCLAAYLNYQHFIHEKEVSVRHSARAMADALRLQTEQTLSVVETTLTTVSLHLREHMPNPGEQRRLLREEGQRLPAFLSLLLIDRHGQAIATSAGQLPAGQSFADREYFRVHLEHPEQGTYFGGPLTGRTFGKQFFPISQRITGRHGEFLGVLMASVEPRTLADVFERFPQGPHGAISLAHIPTRTILARSPGHAQHFAQDIQRSPLFAGLLEHESGLYEVATATDGVERMVAYHRLAKAPLVMLVGYARADLQREYRDLLLQHIAAATLYSALIAGLASLLVRNQKRQREAQLLRDEDRQRLQLATDSAGIGVWEHNLDTGAIRWDAWMYRIYGGEAGSDPHDLWHACILAEDRERVRNEFIHLIESGAACEVDFRILRRDGQLRHLHSLARLRRHGSKQAGRLIGVNIDITHSKQAELELAASRSNLAAQVAARTEELRAAKEAAEAANLAKSTFIANMSHELRTPLHAITGMSDLLRNSELNDKQLRRLDKLDQASEHLLEVINSILEISKIEAGKLELVIARLNPACIAEEAAAMLRSRADAKQLQLSIHIADNCPRTLLGDATCLRQCLINYLGNAIKFTEQGQITLQISVEADDCDSTLLRFAVTDTGIGIPPETIARLFAPFEQADNSISRKYGGTGLGLAITARLAQLMGGTAGADSQIGQGSTFWLTARLRKPPPELH